MDAVFANPGAQCTGVETQENRRTVFPLDPPVGILKDLKNVVPFQIGEDLDALIVALAEGLEAVQNLESLPLTGDDCPFDDAFQLPHVAGPVVLLESVQSFLGDAGDLLAGFLIELG